MRTFCNVVGEAVCGEVIGGEVGVDEGRDIGDMGGDVVMVVWVGDGI